MKNKEDYRIEVMLILFYLGLSIVIGYLLS